MTKHLSTAAAALIFAAGCSHPPVINHGDTFPPESAPTAVGRLAQAQAAAGAKADATLYDASFDGTDLNSLGQGKLDLLLKGTTPGRPVKVYLDVAADQMTARQAAVTTYLKSAGVPDTQIALATGPNPNSTTPAAYTMGGVYKGDNSGAAADGGAPGGGGGGLMGAGAGK